MAWREWDAVELLAVRRQERLHLLVDQGTADEFLFLQLRPELLRAACEAASHPLTLRMQPGYDHSYNFISTFMDDHVRWHADRL
jgi:S-formylglutathione hydrolase